MTSPSIDFIRQALKKSSFLGTSLIRQVQELKLPMPERTWNLTKKDRNVLALGQCGTRYVMASQDNIVYITLDLIEGKMEE
ncbi:9396_t:CDS:2 [Acaulospora morrowiae]|uniref:9396_t:CDS:1 n=1 Tax=Acaulospora morrowiae TaxID=94023 RepID=A0A9N9EB09_9GLOM|nr:9396_t:CDS:2 [Acaulospora morrowiae]